MMESQFFCAWEPVEIDHETARWGLKTAAQGSYWEHMYAHGYLLDGRTEKWYRWTSVASFRPRRRGRVVGIDGGLDGRTPDRDWHRDETCVHVEETAAPPENDLSDYRRRTVVNYPGATAEQFVYAEVPAPGTAVFIDGMQLI